MEKNHLKKYRLIHEYPSSPKLGTIVYLETEDNYMTNMGNDFKLFPKKIVENYPEFWEEIVEKDYEILSYKDIVNGQIYIKDTQLKNCWCIKDGTAPFWKESDLKKSVIHSIKRKSDGEIFTIGDKVFSEYANYTINKISIVNDKCMVSALYDTNYPNGSRLHYNLNNLKKAKQPLFTTEDGVDIFEGDKYYYINNSFNDPWKIIHTKADCPGIIDKNDLNYKRFSTKEKAEKYILMNKPVLSLKEIKETTTIKGLSLKKLEKLVQQKLKS